MCARGRHTALLRSPRPRKRTARAESTSVSIGRSTRPRGSARAATWRITYSETRSLALHRASSETLTATASWTSGTTGSGGRASGQPIVATGPTSTVIASWTSATTLSGARTSVRVRRHAEAAPDDGGQDARQTGRPPGRRARADGLRAGRAFDRRAADRELGGALRRAGRVASRGGPGDRAVGRRGRPRPARSAAGRADRE